MSKKLKIEKVKKREKWNLFGGEADVFEGALLKGPRIELISNSQIIIEGCLGVFEYSESYLKLRLSSGALMLVGQNFSIVSFENENIFVKGKINTLEFAV